MPATTVFHTSSFILRRQAVTLILHKQIEPREGAELARVTQQPGWGQSKDLGLNNEGPESGPLTDRLHCLPLTKDSYRHQLTK